MTDPITSRAQPHAFPHTRWSIVLAARKETSEQSAAALETLCRAYWYPLYAYVRRCGQSPHDAQDLTQEFFARLLEKSCLKAVDPDKGRFRTFLLVALKRFLANEWDRARTQKRGGARTHVSLDTAAAETRYEPEAAMLSTPERIFDRHWALTLLDQTMARLKQDFAGAGKSDEFDRIKVFLTAEKGSISYAETAKAAGMSEGALRVAVHRLRKRFREIFRQEIAHTVASPEAIDEEVRYLMSVLAG
jgi:RNA polymerase sigma factor (sigma-70 family)